MKTIKSFEKIGTSVEFSILADLFLGIFNHSILNDTLSFVDKEHIKELKNIGIEDVDVEYLKSIFKDLYSTNSDTKSEAILEIQYLIEEVKEKLVSIGDYDTLLELQEIFEIHENFENMLENKVPDKKILEFLESLLVEKEISYQYSKDIPTTETFGLLIKSNELNNPLLSFYKKKYDNMTDKNGRPISTQYVVIFTNNTKLLDCNAVAFRNVQGNIDFSKEKDLVAKFLKFNTWVTCLK